VIVVDAAVAAVATANEIELDPSGIVTLAGTVTAVLLLTNVTAAPPVGAVAVSVRVAVTAVPPTIELDDSVTLASAAVVGAVVVVVSSAQPAAARHTKMMTAARPRANRTAGVGTPHRFAKTWRRRHTFVNNLWRLSNSRLPDRQCAGKP
jgi:hypothetical protein